MIQRAGVLLLLAANAIGCCCTGFTRDAQGGDHPQPASPGCSEPARDARTSVFARAVKDFFARAIGSILDGVCYGIVKVCILFWMISTGAIVATTCVIVLLRRHPQPIGRRRFPE